MNNAKTFRLFISSPFNDFKEERRVLHANVFPKIESYCAQKGYQFQPIDLRWGVSYETQLDQKTLKLCLDEVRMCKHFIHPNFIIMSGNRYGWVPLPYAIEKSEFELIVAYHKGNQEALQILNEWYELDTNHLLENSVAYVINARGETTIWKPIEERLREYLQEAANSLYDKDSMEYSKYFHSATDAEVNEGIFQYLNLTKYQNRLESEGFNGVLDRDHVFGYIRTIKALQTYDLTQSPAKFYIDPDQKEVKLFHERINEAIDDDKLLSQEITLNSTAEAAIENSYLIKFERFMLEKLIDSINLQIAVQNEIPALIQERSEQAYYCDLKSAIGFGREKELQVLSEYVNSNSSSLFMVHGHSGIGKTSLIAQSINSFHNEKRTVIFRFIGATASSSAIRSLLLSIVNDLVEKNLIEQPENIEEDSNKFNEQVKKLLLTISQPTVLILDALDQLQEYDYLQWLPVILPPNLKIIISMLDEPGYDFYYTLLAKRVAPQNQLEIKPISLEVADHILMALLQKEHRLLTDEQKQYVLHCFEQSENSPLYLKVAFEEFKNWKSHYHFSATGKEQSLVIGSENIIIKFVENLSSVYRHPKDVIHKVIGYISASKDGMSEKALLDVLARNDSVMQSIGNEFHALPTKMVNGEVRQRFPVSIWARLFEQLRPLMYERSVDDQNLLIFSHRKVSQAFALYCYSDVKIELHKELAAYFTSINQLRERGENHYDLRSLSELPSQLLLAREFKDLLNRVTDLEFTGSIYNVSKHVRFRQVIKEFMKVIVDEDSNIFNTVNEYENFYREKEHLILKYYERDWKPNQSLFQLAYEDAKISKISASAQKLIDKEAVKYSWLRNEWRDKHAYRSGLIKVMHGHQSNINGFIRLQSKALVSWDLDNVFRIWDEDGNLKNVIGIHTDIIKGVLELSDKSVVSWSADHKMFVWEFVEKRFKQFEHHSRAVNGVIALDEEQILSFSDDATLQNLNHYTEEVTAFIGHTDAVNGAIKLTNGTVLSFSDDNSLRLWNQDGSCLRVLKKHTKKIQGILELHNRTLLSYSNDKTLCLWSEEGALLSQWYGHTSNVLGVIQLQNRAVLSYSRDKTLRLWTQSGEALCELNGHHAYITSILELNNGNIISTSRDKSLIIWSQDGEKLKVLNGHTDTVSGVIQLHNNTLLSYSEDMQMILWSQDGEKYKVIKGHSGIISNLIAIDNKFIVSSSWDQTLRLWNIEDTAEYNEDVGHSDKIEDVLICQNHNIVSWSWDETLCLWDKNGKLLNTMCGHKGTINGVIELNDQTLLSWSKDGILIHWDRHGQEIKKQEGHSNIIVGAKQLRNNTVVTWSWDHSLRLWDQNIDEISVLKGHTQTAFGVVELNNNSILSYSFDGTMLLWDSNAKLLALMNQNAHSDWVMGAVELEDETILSYSKDSLIKRWNQNGHLLGDFYGHDDVVRGVVLVDNTTFLSYSDDLTLCIWDYNGQLRRQIKAHQRNINGVLYLNNGTILSYSDDKTIKMWCLDGTLICTLEGHHTAINRVEKLEDGTLVSFDEEGCTIFWSEDGERIQFFPINSSGRIVKKILTNKSEFIAIEHNKIYKYVMMHGDKKMHFNELKDINKVVSEANHE